MRARTDLWEPRGGNALGPPGPAPVDAIWPSFACHHSDGAEIWRPGTRLEALTRSALRFQNH